MAHTATPVRGDLPASPPRRRWRVVALSALAGFLLTVAWSAAFVDKTIGGTVADALLGHDAGTAPVAGVAFAFVSGLAGTFTACNIAAFGAVAPLLGTTAGRWARLRASLAPLGLLAAGMIPVAAVYGALVGLVGTRMPQFDTVPVQAGALTGRAVQSLVVFGVIGLTMVYLGLAALELVPDPFRRRPAARTVLLGALIGGFLIGRPFPLFRVMFRDAAESGNPLYGAAAFVLQSVGNVVVVAVLVLLLGTVAGGPLRRWLGARAAVLTAATLIAVGVFTVLYWDVRLLAGRGVIPWYPTAPWVS
ncbi:hypothetical protein AB0I60_19290 [Actinosynnema sp. NPDC050436]|uniref:hypothetical protein n=1 Tax=Actinosynnema sp. NPDC050436 TaxID=3155659 RepID=UPI0033D8FA2F